jgi:hypothetical protein
MFSLQVKLLVISIFIGSLVIFVLQNTQVVPLVLFGSTIATLPVGIWILGAVFSGILTSVILQLINPSKIPAAPQFSPQQTNRNPPNYPRSPRQSGSNERPFTPPENINIKNKEEQKIKDTRTPEIKEDINKPASETERVKKDSVYSYSYPKDREKMANKKDQVYDANYRVIQPPYQQNQEQSLPEDLEDEEWV